jgi:hypothetical protein
MAKIAPIGVKGGKKRHSVTKKRLKGPDGHIVTMRTIDADSPTFAEDLSYVFRQNVKKARRLNKSLGVVARVAAKS